MKDIFAFQLPACPTIKVVAEGKYTALLSCGTSTYLLQAIIISKLVDVFFIKCPVMHIIPFYVASRAPVCDAL